MFNLYTIVKAIEKIGNAIPDVNTVVLSDIFKLNELPDIDYSVFAIVQDQHRQDDDFIYMNFYLYYVDRLLNDHSNQLEIQSHGMSLLSTVIDKIEDLGLVLSPDTQRIYQSFNQRFSDECAGVYARVEIMVPVDCTTPFDVLVNPLLADLATYQPGTYYPQDFGADAFRVVTVSGQSYHYYTENGKTAKIDNGEHSLTVEQSGVYIDGNEVTTNDVLSGYTYDKQTTNNLIQAALEGFDDVIAQVSSNTINISANTINISANTADISTLSAMTSENTEGIAILSAMTGDFVRKDPTNVEGTSGSPVDFNTLTAETGYYYLTINNEYAVNGPQAGGWQSDGMLEVIRDPESARVIQTFTADFGPLRWYRTYTWLDSGFEWTDWQQPLTGDYVEKNPTLHTYSPSYLFDFDTYTTTGYYVLEGMNSGNTHNCPVEGGNAILHVIALRKDGVLDDSVQIFYTADDNTGNTDIYLRRRYWNSDEDEHHWGPWVLLSGSGSGGGQIDTQMDDNSTNPVENRVVTSAITHLQDEIDNINIGQSWDGDDIQTLLRQINSLTERVAALEACSPCSGDTSGSTSGDTSGSTSGGTLEIPSGLTGNTIVYRATYPQQKYLFNEYEDRFGGAKIIDNYYLTPDGTRVGNIFYSNVDYYKGYGVITFDRPLTAITADVGFNSVSPDGRRTGVYFTEMHLPASLTSLGDYVFDFGANGGRKDIYSLATTAPTITEDSIHRPLDASNHDEGSKLYVPSGATGYDVWLDELGDHWSIENI